MKRDFTDDDFKKFVLSPELAAKAQSLRHTLEDWEKTDLNASAARGLTYLPEQAMIRAKVFPMIKPKISRASFSPYRDYSWPLSSLPGPSGICGQVRKYGCT